MRKKEVATSLQDEKKEEEKKNNTVRTLLIDSIIRLERELGRITSIKEEEELEHRSKLAELSEEILIDLICITASEIEWKKKNKLAISSSSSDPVSGRLEDIRNPLAREMFR
ncbi:hypothetical protein [Candidatus Nitrososphaera gargensis]|uniref:hypothetical protein n=1 Tax=Candidatus Nitrososphaera gargensis TaxID=497727 RepID=UPI0011E56823|nr:hypothetical protein [Candidatus Nitrososphaera gargensis]